MSPHFPVVTERLLLRSVTDDDFSRLFAILADPSVMKLALYERPLSAAEARRFIRQSFSTNSHDVTHLGVLCRAADEIVVGFAGLLWCKYFPEELEIGFVLGTAHQGRGYATEIAKKLIGFGLGELRRDRVLALCDPRNSPSRHVLEKLGMSNIDEIATPDRGQRLVFEIRRSHASEVRK